MKPTIPGPLTGAEIEELDRFLLDAEGSEESMDISTLDGFLTAIICVSKTSMPHRTEEGRDLP